MSTSGCGSRGDVQLPVGGQRQRGQRGDGATAPCTRAGTALHAARTSSTSPSRRGARRSRPAGRAAGSRRHARSTTAAAPTAGASSSRARISSSSIRKPRSLTWLSSRPRCSSCPSGSSRPGRRCGTSAPGAYGSGTNRCRGQVRPVEVADSPHRRRRRRSRRPHRAAPAVRPGRARTGASRAAAGPTDRDPANDLAPGHGLRGHVHGRLGDPEHVDQPAAARGAGRTRTAAAACRAARRRRRPAARESVQPASRRSTSMSWLNALGRLVEHGHLLGVEQTGRTRRDRATPSSGTTTSRPPVVRQPQISHTEKSNALEWNSVHTSRVGEPEVPGRGVSRLTTLRCGTTTPFGRPVEPDV